MSTYLSFFTGINSLKMSCSFEGGGSSPIIGLSIEISIEKLNNNSVFRSNYMKWDRKVISQIMYNLRLKNTPPAPGCSCYFHLT